MFVALATVHCSNLRTYFIPLQLGRIVSFQNKLSNLTKRKKQKTFDFQFIVIVICIYAICKCLLNTIRCIDFFLANCSAGFISLAFRLPLADCFCFLHLLQSMWMDAIFIDATHSKCTHECDSSRTNWTLLHFSLFISLNNFSYCSRFGYKYARAIFVVVVCLKVSQMQLHRERAACLHVEYSYMLSVRSTFVKTNTNNQGRIVSMYIYFDNV